MSEKDILTSGRVSREKKSESFKKQVFEEFNFNNHKSIAQHLSPSSNEPSKQTPHSTASNSQARIAGVAIFIIILFLLVTVLQKREVSKSNKPVQYYPEATTPTEYYLGYEQPLAPSNNESSYNSTLPEKAVVESPAKPVKLTVDEEFDIGWQFYSGVGRNQSHTESYTWFLKAAKRGHVTAQYNLGIMYENGEYIKQDFIIASMWFYVASKNGSSNAKKRIQGLLNDDKLFPNQYNHAKNLAKKYLNIEK